MWERRPSRNLGKFPAVARPRSGINTLIRVRSRLVQPMPFDLARSHDLYHREVATKHLLEPVTQPFSHPAWLDQIAAVRSCNVQGFPIMMRRIPSMLRWRAVIACRNPLLWLDVGCSA
jgi:hypothetical protein